MTLSRRTTLQWMIAAAAVPAARWAPPAFAGEAVRPFPTVAAWPGPPSPLPPTKGYGRDPTLMEPKVVWPLTLTKGQRATVDLLGDMILPADEKSPGAGRLGVGAFIDEWISAPYPNQQADRQVIVAGLGWLDAQARALHGGSFAALTMPQRTAMLTTLSGSAGEGAMQQPVRFMDKMRQLFVLGFYTLPEGKADMGYIGDEPTEGPYPGPSAEALSHLDALLAQLKLKRAVV